MKEIECYPLKSLEQEDDALYSSIVLQQPSNKMRQIIIAVCLLFGAGVALFVLLATIPIFIMLFFTLPILIHGIEDMIINSLIFLPSDLLWLIRIILDIVLYSIGYGSPFGLFGAIALFFIYAAYKYIPSVSKENSNVATKLIITDNIDEAKKIAGMSAVNGTIDKIVINMFTSEWNKMYGALSKSFTIEEIMNRQYKDGAVFATIPLGPFPLMPMGGGLDNQLYSIKMKVNETKNYVVFSMFYDRVLVNNMPTDTKVLFSNTAQVIAITDKKYKEETISAIRHSSAHFGEAAVAWDLERKFNK